VSWFITNQNHKNELENKRIEQQKEYYLEFIEALQNLMDNGEYNKSEDLSRFLNQVNKLYIFADNKTVSVVNKYWDELINSVNSRRALAPDEHKKHHDLIIKSMRNNFKLSNHDLPEIFLIKNSVPAKEI
jgi:hypothetical protein